jgi:hypothetical protein
MRVLRRRHTLGLFTLFALAMQLVLALAETHTHNTALAHGKDLAARAVTYGLCRPTAERPCPAPTQHDDSKCSICVSIAAAGTAVLQAPPPPLVPHGKVVPLPPTRIAAFPHGGETVHFQARAPPLFIEA